MDGYCDAFLPKVLQSERGRGKQQNAGWQAARGEWCLFLHADSQLPPHYDQLIASAVQFTQCRDGSSIRSRWARPREAAWWAKRSRSTCTSTGSGSGGGGSTSSRCGSGTARSRQGDSEVGQAALVSSSLAIGNVYSCRCSASGGAASTATGSSWAARRTGQGCLLSPSVACWGAFKTIRTDVSGSLLVCGKSYGNAGGLELGAICRVGRAVAHSTSCAR